MSRSESRRGASARVRRLCIAVVCALVITITPVGFGVEMAQAASTSFTQGLNGFTGTVDTWLDGTAPTTDFGSSVSADLISTDPEYALIRFDGLVGAGPDQIPAGSTITGATLTVRNNSNPSSGTLSLHRMLVTWSASSTYSSMGNGVQTDDVEASGSPDASTSTNVNVSNAAVTFPGLQAAVQSWVDGSPNHGWVLMIDSSDDWSMHLSEASNSGLRPSLSVTYDPPVPALVVNSTGNSGDSNPGDDVCDTGGTVGADPECTLRAAIQEANASATVDTVHFDIPTSDANYQASPVRFRIPVPTLLTAITDPVTIDGTTQPEFATAGRPVIVLDGTGMTASDPNGITLQAGSSTIRGLVIQNFADDGIEVEIAGGNTIVGNFIGPEVTGTLARPNGYGLSVKTNGNTIGGTTAADRNIVSGNTGWGIALYNAASGNQVSGNYIGTNAAGTADLGNGTDGIRLYGGATANTIGGTAAGAGNVISGNIDGIYLQDAATDGNIIQGNHIGTDATGLVDLGNSDRGIQVESGADNTIIGGTAAGAGNVISGNDNDGVLIGDGASPGTGTTGTVVQGNLIGVGADGTTPLGNTHHGVHITTVDANLIGGTAPGAGNTIAHSSWNGVLVQNSTASANSILGNSIHANGLIGVDLGDDGPTINDAGDGDSGANDLLNHPVITSASESGGTVTVTFDLDVPANPDQYRVEFFANPSGTNVNGAYEAETFVSAVTTAPGTGLTHTFSGSAGDMITASATRIDSGAATGFSSTSEFSTAYSATPALHSDPMAIWKRSALNTPLYRAWDGSSFGPEQASAAVGSWKIVESAESPTADEAIAVGVDAVGSITAERWDGTVWSPASVNPVGSAISTSYWTFDVAYESVSGQALVVAASGSGLRYTVWNGASWSALADVSNFAVLAGGNGPTRVTLAPSPVDDTMILLVTDNLGREVAFAWSGSSWGSGQVLDATSGGDNTSSFAVADAAGQVMAAYSKGAASTLYYRVWNGSTWSGEGSLAAPAGVTAKPVYVRLAADPSSSRIAVGVLTAGVPGTSAVWLDVWDGTAWGAPVLATTTGVDQLFPGVSVAFEGTSGQALAAYGVTAVQTVRYRTWSSGSGWSAEAIGPNLASVPNTMALFSEPGTDGVMLATQDAASDVNYTSWTGSAWGSPMELETNTGETRGQPFTFLWNAAPASPLPPLPPIAVDDSATTTRDVAAGITVLANDSDPNGDVLTIQSVTQGSNGTVVNNGTDVTYSPNASWSGVDTFTYVVSDGNGGTDTATVTVTVTDVTPGLWLSTLGDVGSPSGAPGLASWSAGAILQFTGPGLALEPPATAGTFSLIADLDAQGQDGNVVVTGLDLVTTAITVGGSPSVDLQAGDVLFSTDNNETFVNWDASTTATAAADVVRFRPRTAGNYTSGTFSVLLQAPLASVVDVSLVERATTIGGTTLPAGTFLLSNAKVVYELLPSAAGPGTSPGTPNVFVNGPDVAIDQNIVGLHAVDEAVQMDGVDFYAGDLLVSIDNTDSAVGDNGLSVVRQDVFRLRLTATTAGSGTAAGDATLVFDGSDVGLDVNAEDIEGVVLVGGTAITAPIAVDDALVAMRNEAVVAAPTVNDVDPNGDALSIQSFTQPANGTVTDNGDGTVTYTPDFGFAGSDTFTYTVTDGGETDTATVTVAVRTPELRIATSSNVVASGTLGITSWTTSELLSVGNPSFALDPPTTSGTVGSALDLGAFSADGVVRITAAHRVTTPVTIGSGGGSFDLEPGDLVLAFTDSETLVGDTTSISVTNKDVAVFRPTSPGAPQVGGEFHFLLDDPTGGSINGLAVVERDTIVGDTVIEAGTLLFAYSSSSKVVLAYAPATTGELTTTGTSTTLADMSDVGLGGTIDAVALVERKTTAGGRVLAEGTLLASTDGETTVAGLAVQRFDVFGVSITQTTLVAGTTVATSSMVFDGSDAFFDNNTENVTAVSLFALPDATAGNTAPVAVDDAVSTGPNQSIVIDVVANDTDADLDALIVEAVTDGANGTVVANGDGTVTYTRDALFVGTDTFGYRINDGNGATDTAIVTVTADPSTGALAVWRNRLSTSPQYSRWNGVAFGPSQSSAGVGEWRIMQGAEAPTRNEAIVVGVDAGSFSEIRGERWNGSTWTALPFNPMATVTESFWWGFDVAYEGLSGDAVLVWNNGSTGTSGLTYRVWNGATWTAPQTISTPLGSEPKHLRLVPDPRSDAMILVASNSSSQDYALVWDGSSWGNAVTLSSVGTGDDRTDVYAAWQTESGEAIVVYGKGSTSAYTRRWDGSSWRAETAITPPAGSSGNVRWTVMASDPNSDRIALGVLTSANSIWFAVHDGTSWGTKQLATTTANGIVSQNVSVGFESDTGDLLAVYGTASSNLTYRVLPNGGSWSAAQVGPSVGALQNTMVLYPDPNGDRMMLAAHVDNSDLDYVLWDGTSWGTPYEPTTDTGDVKNQPFEFLWDANQGVVRPTYDITGTIFEDIAGDVLNDGAIGDVNNPGTAGVDVHLYRDADGDGIAEATDTFLETVQTAVDGTYTFTGKRPAKYFVVVDSTTVAPDTGLEVGAVQGDVWAEQTYGPASSDCADGSGGTTIALTAGPCYGGRTGGASDDLTTWYSGAEHLTRVALVDANVAAVDFGFSFNVVTTRLGGDTQDDDPGANRTVQGSLRQFIQNANAVTGANPMRFVPTEPTNATSGANTWWQISVTSLLPVLTDASTTIDGTAYDRVDGITVRQTNTATIGTAGVVGVGPDGRPGTGDEATVATVAGPELEIADGVVSGRLLRGIDTDADDTTIRSLAIWGFGGFTHGTIQAGGDGGDSARDGFLLEDAVVGSTAVGADPGTEASIVGLVVDNWANGTVQRSHIADATDYGIRFGTTLPGWSVLDSHFLDNGSEGLFIVNDGSYAVARNRFDNNGGGMTVVGPPTSVTVLDNSFTNNIGEGAAIGDLDNSTVSRNLFENNTTVGLWMAATTSTVTDNTIRANGTNGVFISLGTNGIDLQRNLISANGTQGIYLDTATGVTFTDNEIIDNGDAGAYIDSSGSTFTTNTITGNGGPGITVTTNALTAKLDRNVFGANGGIAIDLSTGTGTAGDGITPNDAAPPSCGTTSGIGNAGLDTPVIDDVVLTVSLRVTGRACANATIHLYEAVADGDDSDTSGSIGYGEGTVLLGTTTADASGDWSIAGIVGVSPGDGVTAVTMSGSRTSEFSANAVVPVTAVVNSSGDAADAAPGDGNCSTGGLNSEGDPECTLRAAIEEANAFATPDRVEFAIPASDTGHSAGVWTISPATALPAITGTVAIDGSTQPGTVVNTAAAPLPLNGAPSISIDGGGTVVGDGLAVQADSTVIRGLVIGGFVGAGSYAIDITANLVTVAGTYVGTDPTGTTGNASTSGIRVTGTGTMIGGTTPADRNLIAGDHAAQIELDSGPSTQILGNVIGANAAIDAVVGTVGTAVQATTGDDVVIGSAAAPNVIAAPVGASGIVIGGATATIDSNLIGTDATYTHDLGGLEGILVGGAGTTAVLDNVVGNWNLAIRITAPDVVVTGNAVGIDPSGTIAMPNAGAAGIDVDGTGATIGGPDPGDANTISANVGDGIATSVTDTTILSNRIWGNGGLGIDIADDGVTVNSGADSVLDFPEIGSLTASGGVLTVKYTFAGPAGDYRIEFFTNASGADPSGHGEGEALVHVRSLTAHPGGAASYTAVFAGSPGDIVAATATEDAGAGSWGATSEFSRWILAAAPAALFIGDDSIRRSDVTAAGGAPTIVPGAAGDAIDLDGVDDRLVGPGLDVTDTALSMSARVRLDTSAGIQSLISKRDSAGLTLYELAVDGATGEAVATVRLSGTPITARGGSVTTSTWHQLDASWDGADLVLYVDGVEADRVAAVGVLGTDATTHVAIGARSDGTQRIDGQLDEVAVGHAPLDAAAVAVRYLNAQTPTALVTLGDEQTGVPGAWTVDTALSRSGSYSLVAPETSGPATAAWAVARGIDEPGVVFESWWWVTTGSGVDLASGTRTGIVPTDQLGGAGVGAPFRWELRHPSPGADVVDASAPDTATTGAWVEVEMWTDQLGNSRLVVGGVEVIGWTPQTGGAASGSVGLLVGALPTGEQWRIDDPRARKLVTPEPVASLRPLDRG